MRLVRARKVLCLALALTVTFLLSPMALAAPAGEDLRLAVPFEDANAGDKCANPANGTGSFEVTTYDEPSLVALQHHGGHHNRCENARRNCYHHCRHHGGHHHHNCVRHCMRNHGCHHD